MSPLCSQQQTCAVVISRVACSYTECFRPYRCTVTQPLTAGSDCSNDNYCTATCVFQVNSRDKRAHASDTHSGNATATRNTRCTKSTPLHNRPATPQHNQLSLTVLCNMHAMHQTQAHCNHNSLVNTTNNCLSCFIPCQMTAQTAAAGGCRRRRHMQPPAQHSYRA